MDKNNPLDDIDAALGFLEKDRLFMNGIDRMMDETEDFQEDPDLIEEVKDDGGEMEEDTYDAFKNQVD